MAIHRPFQPLNVEVVDGVLNISVGASILADIIAVTLNKTEITNDHGFCREIAYELEQEFSDGSTLVTAMFQNAAYHALDYSQNVKVIEE